MTWNYPYTPAIRSPLLTALFLLPLAVYGWQHRNVLEAMPFSIGSIFFTLWVACREYIWPGSWLWNE